MLASGHANLCWEQGPPPGAFKSAVDVRGFEGYYVHERTNFT